MAILLLLVPISLALLGVAIWAFLWAVRSGQYDDLDSPSIDILRDEAKPQPMQTRNSAPPPGQDADGT